MKKIPLTQGQFALVDNADYEWLMQWKWQATYDPKIKQYRATRNSESINGKRHNIFMANFIMNTPPGMHTDHKNHICLDNHRKNLRVCTPSQNCANRQIASNNTSGFKGVSFHKSSGLWQASIKQHGKQLYLGLYPTPQKASLVYRKKAKELFGEYAFCDLQKRKDYRKNG